MSFFSGEAGIHGKLTPNRKGRPKIAATDGFSVEQFGVVIKIIE